MKMSSLFDWCRKLTDEELLKELEAARQDVQQMLIRFLVCLSEVNRRHLLEKNGFPSPFKYCTEKLGMSADEAFRRTRASYAAAKYPQILTYLSEGTMSLTVIAMLEPHLTLENVSQVLERAMKKSVRE